MTYLHEIIKDAIKVQLVTDLTVAAYCHRYTLKSNSTPWRLIVQSLSEDLKYGLNFTLDKIIYCGTNPSLDYSWLRIDVPVSTITDDKIRSSARPISTIANGKSYTRLAIIYIEHDIRIVYETIYANYYQVRQRLISFDEEDFTELTINSIRNSN